MVGCGVPADANAPLGVFDSGVGGLTVLKELQSALPHEDFIYIGDTARVPYGSKPADMVRDFALQISEALLEMGVKGIVVACNSAASTGFIAGFGTPPPVPVWSVIEPGVRAALQARSGGTVGILGTTGTVKSGAYQTRLEAAGAATWAKACPLFVPIVEEGVSDTEIAELVARHYLGERPPLDVAILGCTHYPVLKNTLQRVLGDEVTLVDSALETAAAVAGDLERLHLAAHRDRAGEVRHLVTGDVATYRHALEVLAGPAGTVERYDLPARDGRQRMRKVG